MFAPFQAVLKRVLGSRDDAASSTGSLHAKIKDIADNQLPLLQKPRGGIKGSYTALAGAYRTALNLTGKGTLKALQLTTVNFTCKFRMTVDGNVICVGRCPTTGVTQAYLPLSIAYFTNSDATDIFATEANGGNAQNLEVSFNTSLLLEIYPDTTNMTLAWVYDLE